MDAYLGKPVTPADVVWSYSGVRPLYDNAAGSASRVTRDYVLDGSKPVLSLTQKGDETRVSARATQGLFNNGLDLSKVMHEAAVHVGGSGGGHPVASGATIPKDSEKEFLQKVDSVIKFQLE